MTVYFIETFHMLASKMILWNLDVQECFRKELRLMLQLRLVSISWFI